MKLSNIFFSLGAVVITSVSIGTGLTNDVSLGNTAGQIAGTMVGYAAVWFIYSRVEFQVTRAMQERAIKKKRNGENESR